MCVTYGFISGTLSLTKYFFGGRSLPNAAPNGGKILMLLRRLECYWAGPCYRAHIKSFVVNASHSKNKE
jgi:hypothetical protein